MIAEGAIDSGKIANTVALGGPKITGLDYPGDDTAALPAGGQTIIVNGDNFQSGCTVYVDGTVISVVSFLSESQLQFVAPAKATGLYAFYVVNPDGGTAILVPGMVYSGTPTWTTASGSLGTPYETNAFSVNLAATGDGALSYAVTTGSSLPTGLSLSSAGAITGTVPATAADTTYTFNVDVIDAENQSTTRQFSITYKVDVITWSSPAAGASFTVNLGQANTTALSATSAAGKSVSFSVQSGSLPTGIAISGSNISGTATVAQANTSVIIRATAADTARYADRTFYYTAVAQEEPYWSSTVLLMNFNGSNDGTSFTESKSNLSVTNGGGVTKTDVKKYGTASGYFSGGTYLDIADDGSLNFSNFSWTIEFWMYKTVNQSYPGGFLLSKMGTNQENHSWHVVAEGSGGSYGILLQTYDRDSSGNFLGASTLSGGSGLLTTNTWHHVAITRQSSVIKLWVNGQLQNQLTYGTSKVIQHAYNTPLRVGSGPSAWGSAYSYTGYIDDLRITKFYARYTDTFTPPTAELGQYL